MIKNSKKSYFLSGGVSFKYNTKRNIQKSDFNYDDYTYQTTTEPNPFQLNNFFIEEYNLLNLETIDVLILPVYFNKYKVLNIKKNGTLYRSFATTADLNGKINYFKINGYDWLTGEIRLNRYFEFFYK